MVAIDLASRQSRCAFRLVSTDRRTARNSLKADLLADIEVASAVDIT